jgi:hypothetical protein
MRTLSAPARRNEIGDAMQSDEQQTLIAALVKCEKSCISKLRIPEILAAVEKVRRYFDYLRGAPQMRE